MRHLMEAGLLIETIRGIHTPRTEAGIEWCSECAHAYPCATIRAIQETVVITVDDSSADFAAQIYEHGGDRQ